MLITKDINFADEISKAEVQIEQILVKLQVNLGLKVEDVQVRTFDISSVNEPKSVQLVKIYVSV